MTIYFIYFLKKFYWSRVDLQCCVSFCCTVKCTVYTYTSVQFSSVAQSCLTLCDPCTTAARQASLSITNSMSTQTSVHRVSDAIQPSHALLSNHLILCCPLLFLPSIFPSIRVFSNESALSIRWPKYWSFSFNISPSSEYSGLVFFRMDWLDLLAVQGTRKSLLQHHVYLWRIHFDIWQN